VIKNPAARIAAAAIIVGGLTVAPLLDRSDPPNAQPGAPVPTSAAQFQIQWRPGELALSGHTRSGSHEQDLIQVANSTFGDNAVLTAFEPLGVVPDYWADLTTQVLYLLAVTSSADANLSPEQLDIRGVIVDELSWKSRLNAVRNALPRQVALNVDTLLVDEAIDLSAVCDRAFARFEAGPINFAESSVEFRASAYPRLGRLLALASACEDSWVSVTGHTDATGSEAWNQRLSLQRAQAVGDYLVTGGVDRARLLLAGVGSSSPVADDNTRYGRSLNRRIDIELRLARQND
jgi:outer membrane protein OmpA-like peptidoglycan-associated protein